jgi:glycosyltransferase involved in cell wall biosynthesis
MRVSIITPTYNRAELLPETIESILDQNYPDLEYIVLDDGSTDDTQSVLARYSERLRIERHDNMGETATVNKGFSLVTGDIVCVVCSDDPLLPGAIQQIVDVFEMNPAAIAVYPDWMDIGPKSEFLRAFHLPDYDVRVIFTSLSCGIGPGAFFRRSLIQQVGGRNPSRVFCGDMEFWMIAAMLGQLVHVPILLATHRTHADSASVSQKSGKFAREWVDTWKCMLSRAELPANVAVHRHWIFAAVHLIAARSYCGADRNSALQLYARSLFPVLRCLVSLTAWQRLIRLARVKISRSTAPLK